MIEAAFAALAERSGFSERSDQIQLSLLLSDLIAERGTGAFEAPTGLGKSLATLVPAIAHAALHGKRIVVATYTNVLAEQYWHKDLPLALSLFEFGELPVPKAQFLIGRQRYVCLTALDEAAPNEVDGFRARADLGIETEFRRQFRGREGLQLWQKVSAPPVCPGRLCPAYDDCYYYKARRGAEDAKIIITNHSVAIQDAIIAGYSEDGTSLLGDYDFLILDEAHDFASAAQNGLEFELSAGKLSMALGLLGRLENSTQRLAQDAGNGQEWAAEVARMRAAIEAKQRDLLGFGFSEGKSGILSASPTELEESPAVQQARAADLREASEAYAMEVAALFRDFAKSVQNRLASWRDRDPERARQVAESIGGYQMFFREMGVGAESIFRPRGVSVSYVGRNGQDMMLRQDAIDLAEPLRELIWNRKPYACLSATLAIDGAFDHLRRTLGIDPGFEEILPSPFDFSTQAAVYVPKTGAIPDPTTARREGSEDYYFAAVARELREIIEACRGRTLALFHSRREMEAVFMRMNLPPELPVLMQGKSGAAAVGEKFKAVPESSLFALRSFWTGFDAPGETLSCVVIVRVPFEVPVEPPQIARMAYLNSQGIDPFREHSLANAKMMMRQGVGRLIRSTEDKGVIALLDPRLRSKRYGEEILDNLPANMRRFDDIADAVGWIGLE